MSTTLEPYREKYEAGHHGYQRAIYALMDVLGQLNCVLAESNTDAIDDARLMVRDAMQLMLDAGQVYVGARINLETAKAVLAFKADKPQ